jgi:hypothetical protein
MGQGQKQGQDNPLRGMKMMMRDGKIDDGWRVTTRDKGWTKRSTLCETKMRTIMREKKRGQWGRYATIDRTWDDDHENKRQWYYYMYLIKRTCRGLIFFILSDICQYIMCEYTQW